jgi:hypothetical protein
MTSWSIVELFLSMIFKVKNLNVIISMAQVKGVGRRILMIGLDGFDLSLANQFAKVGLMPNLKRLHSRSVRVQLDCGRDRFSGLAWEHFSSGRSPSDGGRWSAIHFDPVKYNVSQKLTSARPFPADLSTKTVVFDVPYFDLRMAPNVEGITLVLFAPHGMGPNHADVAAMALLPELLYRAAFGTSFMRPVRWSGALPDGTPLLREHANWEWTMEEAVPHPPGKDTWRESNVSWMPAYRYRHLWAQMPAFALPSFYDGRIRINLQGRKAHGTVSPEEYQSTCQRLSGILSECMNLLTMEPAVEEVYETDNHPLNLDNYEADLYVIWKSAPLGLMSPRFGNIGPLPFRRTGAHTGQYGFLYISGEGLWPHDVEIMSTFDVVPTLLQLLGEPYLQTASGRSFADVIFGGSALIR